MKTDHKDRLKAHLKGHLGRNPSAAESANSENDALLLVRILLDAVSDLEEAVKIIKKKINVL